LYQVGDLFKLNVKLRYQNVNKRSNIRGILSLYPVFKVYGGLVVQFHAFLTSATDEGEQIVSRFGRFIQRKEPKIPIKRKNVRTLKQV